MKCHISYLYSHLYFSSHHGSSKHLLFLTYDSILFSIHIGITVLYTSSAEIALCNCHRVDLAIMFSTKKGKTFVHINCLQVSTRPILILPNVRTGTFEWNQRISVKNDRAFLSYTTLLKH